MKTGTLEDLNAQLELFEADYVVTIRKSWSIYERHQCNSESEYWEAVGRQPFGVDRSVTTSPTGKSLSFSVAF